MKRLLLGALALVALMAGCTALAHLKTLQPPAVPSSAPITLPRLIATPHAVTSQAVAAGTFQRGIDIDLYTYPGQDFRSASAADVAFIRHLHANAVSVSFPFFMAGPESSAVYGASPTPSPSQLAILVRDAHRAGLYVSLRPLLDETNLGISRVHWQPNHPAAWFRSYRQFLLPYAAMAQREHVNEFFVGSEFPLFADSPRWNSLDRALRRRFHGTLACSSNWGPVSFANDCGKGVVEAVDAYQPQHGALLAGWEKYDRLLPVGTVEAEVGIDAVKGAYRKPYQHSWRTAVLDPAVHPHWFTAACRAAAIAHLGGIYFWSVGFSKQPASGPTVKYQGGWAGGAGAQAISRCFRALSSGHK